MGIDPIDHLPPGIDEAIFAGEEVSVAEAVQAEVVIVAMRGCAGLRHLDAEAPAVDPTVPLAARRRSGFTVEADVGRDDTVVVEDALPPGVNVFEDPLLVLLLSRGGERRQRQRR